MKLINSRQIKLLILILSFNILIVSNIYKLNLYSNDDTPLLIDFSFSNNSNENFGEEIDAITGLRRKIIRWEEIVFELSLTGMENRFSYQDESLVKIREDNKIEFIVKREVSDFTPQQIEVFSKYDIEIYEELSSLNSSIIYIPLSFNGQPFYSFLDELMEIPGISYIEPNFYDELAYNTNDPYYDTYQWDMQLIGMETAWDFQLGSNDVLVAVLDTGINYNHEDLSGNYVPLGYDWVNGDDDPMDDHLHGSHCAGTIAASTFNMKGVAGMAQVSIFAEKVFDASTPPSCSHANFKAGIIHAVDMGADIVSFSAGGSHSTTKWEGVDYALSNGVMVIAAAGNDGTNTPSYPASYKDVIAVSATDQNDQKASFSNYGSWIDVSAPGVSILSTALGNSYSWKNGTSMAVPHVSGLAALIKSEYPSYGSSQIENMIKNNAVDLGTPGFDQYFGYGRIDAHNLFSNDVPNKPSNPNPSDGATGISINPVLSVDVSDPNRDSMDVEFYDAIDNSLIGTDNGVSDGGTASVNWLGLINGNTYSWYTVADDRLDSTQSPTWSFTTNYAPDILTNPSPADGATGVNTNPTLSVDVSDPDRDSMDVSFYNVFDDSLIGTDMGVASGGTASISWLNLSEGTIYNWYAVANDGTTSTTSSTWSFTTNYVVQFIYGTDYGPVDLDPHYAWEIPSIDVIDQVVETLYAYDLADPELAPIPRLASDFGTWSIDGLNYTVPLRMGVTFHDGTPFNAITVKWNFNRLAYFMNLDGTLPPEIPPAPFSTLYLWPDGTPIINKVEIVDDYTVKFVLNKQFAPFEALLCFSGSGIMSPASTPRYNYIDTATGDLVGTGPFVYNNYEVDVEVTMHAYENYWAGAAYIDELTFSIIPDINGRNLALLDGSIDFIRTPQNSFLQLFRDDPDITLVDAGQDATIRFLGMNNRLINVSFREAISYAINYTYMIDELLGGEAVRLKSPIPLGIPYANWSFNVPILNLTRARQVMQSMGFGVVFDVNNDADWVNQESTSPFAIFNYSYIFGTFREDILVLLQDNLSKIGIRVTGAGMTRQDFFGKLLDIPPHSKNQLELFWLGWLPDYNDPSNIINNLFSNNSVSNFAQVDDDLVQEWMEEALITINPAERKVLYNKIQQRLIEVVFPWAWGYVRRNYDAHSNDFIGFQSNPMDKVWFYSVYKDTDGDGLSDGEEVNIYGTNPLNPDSDGDWLSDFEEVIIYKTDPLGFDTDGDGLSDFEEIIIYKTDPLVFDTDGDGLGDGEEVYDYGTDPLEPVDTYTPSGINVEIKDDNTGISIEFENIEIPGATTIEESDIKPKIPPGFMIAGLPGTYISITTTATYSGSIIICIPYDDSELSVKEEYALNLIHWNSTTEKWEDITLFVDTVNDIICGEVESLSIFTIILDIAPPSISILSPGEDDALQDGITFKINVTDSSEIDWVNISIRELGGDEVFVGAATHVIDDEWQLSFDTTILPDGYYQIIVEASDIIGNTASAPPLNISIRNWAVLELLPATEENNPGRTVPVKFSLRVAEVVDPNTPFVRNEEITILIYTLDNPNVILHSATYGDTSEDYRIDSVGELYITNYKTLKKPKTYLVEVWRKGMLIGNFTFNTVGKKVNLQDSGDSTDVSKIGSLEIVQNFNRLYLYTCFPFGLFAFLWIIADMLKNKKFKK